MFDNFVVRFQSKTHSSTKQSRWFLSCSRKATGNPQVIFTLPAIVRQHGDKWSYQKNWFMNGDAGKRIYAKHISMTTGEEVP